MNKRLAITRAGFPSPAEDFAAKRTGIEFLPWQVP